MKLVEKHIFKANSVFYKEINNICFKSKNLYNKALYVVRKEFIDNEKYINFFTLDKIAQSWEEYKDLGAMQAQQTLKMLDQNWKSFLLLLKTGRKTLTNTKVDLNYLNT